MKALAIGATGAVGKDLVGQLLKDDSFDRVDVFVRREIKVSSPKLVPHVVDFDHPETWSDLLTGDVLFSCRRRPGRTVFSSMYSSRPSELHPSRRSST